MAQPRWVLHAGAAALVWSIAAPAAAELAKDSAQPQAPEVRTSAFGVPVTAVALGSARGGTDVFNDMKLKGVVADNQAANLSTGGNVIADGAFSGASGLPMVIQNSGNNVLIQNATIVNVQLQ